MTVSLGNLAAEIALALGLIGGVVGLIGIILAGVALSRVVNLRGELRRTQARERADRAALRAELLRAIGARGAGGATTSEPVADAPAAEAGAAPSATDVPAEEPEEIMWGDMPTTATTGAPERPASPAHGGRPPATSAGEPIAGVIRGLTRENTAAAHRPAASQPPGLAAESVRGASGGTSGGAGFEQFLGTKMLVWLGGLALALAMGFFVHHAFKNNWVTPEIRLIGGALFSLVLVGLADFLKAKADVVAQAMSGAGIAGLYAVIYSANHFYGFIGSPLDFLLSVLVTAAAVVLALRHGPFTAVLGLLGGFVMPVLLRTGDPVGGAFFGYLILLQLALVAVGRRRDWRWLSVLSLVFGALWGGVSVLDLFPITARVWPEGLFFGMAAVYVFAAWPTQRSDGKSGPVWLGFVGVCVSLLLMLAHVSSGEYEPRGLGMLGLMAAAALVLARLDARFLRLPWAALAAVAGMLMAYAAWGQRGTDPPRGFVTGFAAAAGGYAAVLVVGAWTCTWRSRRTVEWAGFSLASGVVVFGLVLSGLWGVVADGFAWWPWAAGGAGLYAAMVVPRYRGLRRGEAGPATDRAIGVWTVGSALFAGAAVALAGYDQSPWMRLGWAALALLAWAVFLRLGIAVCRNVVVTLAALVGLCAVWAGPFFEPIASTPVWNELLLGYGGSAVLLGGLAWWAIRREDRELGEAVQGIGLVVVFLASAVLIRHAFEGSDWDAPYSLYEAATHAVAWLTLGVVFVTLGSARRQRVLRIGGALYGVAGTLVALLGSALILNPLWNRDPVGAGLVLNGLLYVYLLPAALALGLAALLRTQKVRPFEIVRQAPGWLGAACLLLVLVWVSLNVRQGFVGPILHLGDSDMTSAEWYAYSVAWVLLGGLLLVIGVVTGSATARWGSLALMMLTVVKVFIFDAAGLRDLYRVLSFLGLGVSLMGLGVVYQRFVFRKPPSEDAGSALPETPSV